MQYLNQLRFECQLDKGEKRHCPHMAVVNSAGLKQCEEGKLFLKLVKCFLSGRCGK